MPRVEFKPMIPVFERANALDRAATVFGSGILTPVANLDIHVIFLPQGDLYKVWTDLACM
jgi:hypothetical protein